MSSRKAFKKIPPAKRRELDVAAAVARESIMQLHVTRAVKLIDLSADRVSAVRVLNVYLRLHGMTGPTAELMAGRVLASLGHRASRGSVATLFVEGEDSAEPETTSLFRVVRDRLRGRVHHELRRWFELYTGATHVALLEVHVRHAQKFVRELGETHSISSACTVYCELVGVPVAMREPLYLFVLDRLSTEELPRSKAKPTASVEDVQLFADPARAKAVIVS